MRTAAAFMAALAAWRDTTRGMLAAAQAGRWDELARLEARRGRLPPLPGELPDGVTAEAVRPAIEELLAWNEAVTARASARRDEIGQDIASRGNQRRLRKAYGP